MKKLAIVIIPLFAGYLCAQTETHSSTTTTTYNGTLVDASCQSTLHTEHHESTTTTPTGQTTTTRESSQTTECPVTSTTTTFGLMTPEGQYIRFDNPSNTKVIEVIKTNRGWTRDITDRQPIRVTVIGQPNGDMVVVRSIH